MNVALLGLRLAISRPGRLRSLFTVLATALGTTLLLLTVAVGRAELATAASYQAEMPRIVSAVVLSVGLPCLLLISTVARFAAPVRDRRLANLRLMGLTPNQTRLVAALEACAGAVVGTLLAWPLFWAIRPLLTGREIVGRFWSEAVLAPTFLDQLLILVLAPAVVVMVAVLPQTDSAAGMLSRMRRADRTPPRLWRVAPLVLGVLLCGAVIARGPEAELDSATVTALFAGVGLTGVGLVLVVPIFVQLCAVLVLRVASGPAARLAARRLEAQPSGVTRVVAGLLIGLFLVTGARFVLVAFESTPQYVAAARAIEQEQRVETYVKQSKAPAALAAAETVPGVTAASFPVLSTACENSCLTAVVATCAQLDALLPGATGCRDDRAMWIHPAAAADLAMLDPELAEQDHFEWFAGPQDERRTRVHASPAELPSIDELSNGRSIYSEFAAIQPEVIIPPSLLGELPKNTQHLLVFLGPPGRDLSDKLEAADALGGISTVADFAYYDFVAGMRLLVWSLAAVILAVGLLTFAIAGIDRAIERRKEMVALQLIGGPSTLIRRAQWWEALVPNGIGSTLAVGLGALAGATYLTLDEAISMPWHQTWSLAGAAAVGSAVVAGLTVIACAPRIRPDLIRAE